jgi:transcriptional regulator with XRE-family HTH domain
MTGSRFGTLLRSLREEKGLSQAALGSKLGLNQTLLSQIERGISGMPEECLPTLAEILQADLDILTAAHRERRGGRRPPGHNGTTGATTLAAARGGAAAGLAETRDPIVWRRSAGERLESLAIEAFQHEEDVLAQALRQLAQECRESA